MKLEIFKLGRLQFQKSIYFGDKIITKNGKTVKNGDRVIFIHIPRGEALIKEKCTESLERCEDFYKKYFPKYCSCVYMCNSWMLYEGNKNFMKEGSNILSFSEMFEVVKTVEQPWDTYRWVYGKSLDRKELMKNKKQTGSYGFTEAMPQISSLQKSLTEYINSGGSLGVGMGVYEEK